jgi:hypothetical protein
MPVRHGVKCPHCGLTLTPRTPILLPRHCPRCIVRRHTIVQLEPCSIEHGEPRANRGSDHDRSMAPPTPAGGRA